jgi:hypothetical protein
MELEFDHVRVEASQAQAVTTLKAPAGDCWESAVSLILVALFFRQPPIQWHWECRATMKSVLRVCMYPVGYQVISDNLEYEDETS